MTSLIQMTESGMYCPAGDFYLDPWRPVPRAVISHAHRDHAREGMQQYLCSDRSAGVLRERVGSEAAIQTLRYGEELRVGDASLSLHSAGHLLGSSQIRIEHRGEVVVFSGDYKTQSDPTCAPLEPLRCHTFITESTFGLPIYRWPAPEDVAEEINAWWRQNQERGRTSVIFAYALGKAQRVLAALDPTIGPILLHGAVNRFYLAYEREGVALPAAEYAGLENSKAGRGKAMVVAPPSAAATPWLRKFGPISTAMASGWMQIRGARRRRSMDRGFVLSDHADWDGLIATIRATGAENIWVTHGYTAEMVRWLTENGLNARAIATRYEGEVEDPEPTETEGGNTPGDEPPA